MEQENYEECTCDQMSKDDLHPCPYVQDIHNDESEKSYCNCCPYCTYQCALDI